MRAMAQAKGRIMAAKQGLTGFIGVGVMGSRMARRMLEAGFPLLIHDVNPAAVKPLAKLGARVAHSAREVADQARIVYASVPTPAVLREVALGDNGLIRGKAMKILVDLSTTGSAVEKEIGDALAARGIDLVDSPVSGGASGADKGTLAVMVAGKPRAISAVRPALNVIGKVFIAGNKPGQAQLMKLLNNLLSQSALAMSLEVFVAGAKAGLDLDTLTDVINAGSGRNSATEEKIPKSVLTRKFDFGFPISGACKDISLAIEECQAMGLPMIVGSAARQLYQFAYNQGGGKRDMTALVTYLEPWAGVEVRGKAARGKSAR
jgi:3-hydroxyisobutyrate dehydrogenase-like beta-hydroxyacid dehydrogenase